MVDEPAHDQLQHHGDDDGQNEGFQERAPKRLAMQDQPLLQGFDEQGHEHGAEAVDPVGVVPRVGPHGVVVGYDAEALVHQPAVGHFQPMAQDAA